VTGAVEEGTLDPARLASYMKLLAEMAAVARRTDPVLRRAAVSATKAQVKMMKARARRKQP
jgi:hypothetical protein